MKTRKKFNWLTTLRRLAKRKTPINRTELGRLKRLSNQWPTCACGQLCKKLPKFNDGKPRDATLHTLGYKFNNLLWGASFPNWKKALATFLEIEKRTAMLLRKKGKR